MKTFHCTSCQNLVFFENIKCLVCGHPLAYLPDQRLIAALAQGTDGFWSRPGDSAQNYRLCENYDKENVCNWAVPADEPEILCGSCRLTSVIPDLSRQGNKEAWYRLEVAKRRLIYSLQGLRLPVLSKQADPSAGLEFELKEDVEDPAAEPVFTGHDQGLIVINIAEADDVRREQQRKQQHEPYRTLLGHFRHEIGHYYWNRLIEHGTRLDAFRQLFGNERADYGEALKRHYEQGPPGDWEKAFISAYATTHPWEDWAETWAHYLHISDALETAGAVGLSLKPRRADEPFMAAPEIGTVPKAGGFEAMIQAWLPLTYMLNNLSRGLGLPDSYPFLLSVPVIEKLRFIHETIAAFSAATVSVKATQSG